MIKKMTLEIYTGGGYIERELIYEGSASSIAKQIQNDENELLYYMRTGDDKGEKCFVFQGFMFSKKPIAAAQIKEPEF